MERSKAGTEKQGVPTPQCLSLPIKISCYTKYKNNKHNMVLFYGKLKKNNEIQSIKNK